MIIIYTPEGGVPERYDARTLRVSEASIVQRTVDMKWAEIQAGLSSEDLDAMRGVVWVLKKRSQPSLRFGEFDPAVDEMVTRMDRREITEYVKAAFSTLGGESDVTRADIAHALREMPTAADDPEHAAALIAEMAADSPKDEEPPAPEPPEQEATPDSAPPSPSLTSSSPEASTSPSSPTSSTSPPTSSTT